MRNHHYGDLSNLNAPYDAVPLQGYGALGQADDPKYPWKEDSTDTLLLQQDLSDFLVLGEGLCPLILDSELGPKTCAASRLALSRGAMSVIPSTCDVHLDEAQDVSVLDSPPCPSGGVSPTPTPAPSEPGLEEPVKTGGGIPGWVIGVGLGAVAIAVALALKSNKR